MNPLELNVRVNVVSMDPEELRSRRKIIRIDPDVLIGLGKKAGITTVGSPVPEDARVVHRHVDERGELVLIVESAEFPVVLEGSWIETMPGPAFRSPEHEHRG